MAVYNICTFRIYQIIMKIFDIDLIFIFQKDFFKIKYNIIVCSSLTIIIYDPVVIVQ